MPLESSASACPVFEMDGGHWRKERKGSRVYNVLTTTISGRQSHSSDTTRHGDAGRT